MGDFNKTPIKDILDSYGPLQSIQKEATRCFDVLDLIITDLHTSYFPTLTMLSLEVDEDMKGVFPPVPLWGSYCQAREEISIFLFHLQ